MLIKHFENLTNLLSRKGSKRGGDALNLRLAYRAENNGWLCPADTDDD